MGEKKLNRAALEADARRNRMDRVAVLFAEISAATRSFLSALAESDRHEDWKSEGFGSCAEWLAWRIGVTRNTANEKVRVARALEGLPLTSEAMARGELSFSKVRALTRVATPENEEELLRLARAGSAANLERVVRSWKEMDRWSEAERELRRHRRRRLSIFPDEDGMYVIRGVLDPEAAKALMRAVEAGSDALCQEASQSPVPEDDRPEPDQLRADALGLVAERALAAGFDGGGAEATGDSATEDADNAPVSGTRAERYQVFLHVDESTLSADREPGLAELEDGTRVTAETARRLSCDASVVEVRKDSGGHVLDVGRKRRTVPPALRRALETRDRGCRFPGCGLRFTDAHHIEHWADGGKTSLANTVLLCRRHHRSVHEEGWRVCSDKEGRKVVFFSPTGRPVADAPPLMPVRDGPGDGRATEEAPKAAPGKRAALPERLVRRNRANGVTPDGWAITQDYHRDAWIPPEIEVAAWEALDSKPLEPPPQLPQ